MSGGQQLNFEYTVPINFELPPESFGFSDGIIVGIRVYNPLGGGGLSEYY